MAHNAIPAIDIPGNKKIILVLRTVMILVLVSGFLMQPELVDAASGCASSTPSSGAYTVTLCFSSPGNGVSLTGVETVTPTISVSGTNPGVQSIVYSISGQYLLSAFQSPYSFKLNSALFVDGSYNMTGVSVMRDGYTTINAGSINVTLKNGVTSPPVNNNHFTSSLGTTPAPGNPFVVAAAGDGASGETSSANVASILKTMNPNLFLYLGDVYENGSLTEFNNWYGFMVFK